MARISSLAKHLKAMTISKIRKFLASMSFPFLSALDRECRLVPVPMVSVSKNVVDLNTANHLIAGFIRENRGASIGRFGRSELICTLQQLRLQTWPAWKRIAYASASLEPLGWDEQANDHLWISGFYPYWEEAALASFAGLIRESAKNLDLLGSWIPGENLLPELSPKIPVTPLPFIEPFFAERPWSWALEGKNVLVIHPFERSISAQYNRRHKLFPNRWVLPDFELTTISPPVTRVHPAQKANASKTSWFEYFETLKSRVVETNFDIALIGAGSYGMPISSFIKEMGKVSINLGGATQLLFGIWGTRWNTNKLVNELRNEYWVRPRADEIPEDYRLIEGGAYW